jgi:hypothetical protein
MALLRPSGFISSLTVHPKKIVFEVKLPRSPICFATEVEAKLQSGLPGGACGDNDREVR